MDRKAFQISINDMYYSMLNNPYFKNFVKNNKNKSIEEIAIEYDIKIELIKGEKCI